MIEMRATEDRLLANFLAELTEIDRTAQVILKGGVLIDAQLNNIINSLVDVPDYWAQANFHFCQKVNLLRAAVFGGDGRQAWPLVLGFNELRDTLAYGEPNKERSDQIEKLREMLVTRAPGEAKQSLREGSELEIATLAGAMAFDFLTSLEDQMWHIAERSALESSTVCHPSLVKGHSARASREGEPLDGIPISSR